MLSWGEAAKVSGGGPNYKECWPWRGYLILFVLRVHITVRILPYSLLLLRLSMCSICNRDHVSVHEMLLCPYFISLTLLRPYPALRFTTCPAALLFFFAVFTPSWNRKGPHRDLIELIIIIIIFFALALLCLYPLSAYHLRSTAYPAEVRTHRNADT